ncbi:MAG: chemotaxis protein CheA [Pseudomonadota bacterium]|nr:chemotaxis protein CheA [Pseudomonadota bacterium]
MGLDVDYDILQDFLIEAGELVEQLGEQLVELEQKPDDTELLNAVFRGFHTVKGGAGFVGADHLVEICHHAEDVFNLLRQGDRTITPDLMDTILSVVDTVRAMLETLSQKTLPAPADPDLLSQLSSYLTEEDAGTPPATEEALASSPAVAEDPADRAFDALLAETTSDADLAGSQTPPVSPGGDGSDVMTDDEFEALLDELHGTGAPGSNSSGPSAPSDQKTPETQSVAPVPEQSTTAGSQASAAPSRPPETTKAAPRPSSHVSAQETTVRVDTRSLDTIMNLVGELVLVRNRLQTLRDSIGNEYIQQVASNLDLVTSDLQSAVMKTRMQPIKKIFSRFPRVVRDLARSMGKEINLEMTGEETGLDKNLVEALADPMVHLVRNAVDHGIERPDVRIRNGKPRAGRVLLSAENEGDNILLTISDDGAGMDPEVLRQKAIEKELMTAEAAARLDERECFNLIFAPGFSTAQQISDVSGRGVGMDVVKTRISQLNGSVDIDSELGKGTKLILRVPLTLAILPTLMIKVQGKPFALPLSNVEEILPLSELDMSVVDGQEVVMVRERPLPLMHLSECLGMERTPKGAHGDSHVVTIHVGNTRLGLSVDDVLGQEEVVIKPLGALLHGMSGYAGATITGDGYIALILDVPGLLGRLAKSRREFLRAS